MVDEPERRQNPPEDRLVAVEQRVEGVEGALWAFIPKTMRYLRGIVLALFMFGGLFTLLLNQNSDRVADVGRLAVQIQQSRVKITTANCKAQNQRHDDTIKALDTVLNVAINRAKSMSETQQIRQSRSFTVLLIDALSPIQDCTALAQRAAGR